MNIYIYISILHIFMIYFNIYAININTYTYLYIKFIYIKISNNVFFYNIHNITIINKKMNLIFINSILIYNQLIFFFFYFFIYKFKKIKKKKKKIYKNIKIFI